MSAGIPHKFKIDYTGLYGMDMAAPALARLLSQHWNSPVLKQFVAALIHAGPEETFRRIVSTLEANTLYMAEGGNLEVIGRIVGQPRTPYQYDDSKWFTSDRPGQGADQSPAWVINAPMTGNVPASDPEYRQMILARIACNFCRFASAPEMAYLVKFATGRTVSWRRVGPMECMVIVSGDISRTHLDILTRTRTTTECDGMYWIPYPATLRLTGVTFLPKKPFIADRGEGHQSDAGRVAITRLLED